MNNSNVEENLMDTEEVGKRAEELFSSGMY